MKNMLLASAATSALFYSLPVQAQECTAAPDCSTLGYTKTASQCSGKTYTRCPFDTSRYNCADSAAAAADCSALGYNDKKEYCPGNFVVCPSNDAAVRCLLDAKPGDLKYSLRTKDHDGWLLCNGTTYDPKKWPELYAAIGETFANKLPSYSGYFLKAAATSSQTTFKTAELAGLPNISGSFFARGPEYAFATASGAFSVSAYSNYGSGHSSADSSTQVSFNASKSNSIYGRSTTVTPANFKANIFIFAGRQMSAQTTCEKGGYPNTPPIGQTCDKKHVQIGNTGLGCYVNCRADSLWDFCVKRYTRGYTDHPEYCYDEHYETCGNYISYIRAESDISDIGCKVYVNSLASSCDFDTSCMSSEFGL